MTFQEMLKERLSPTDWQRLQAFTASMAPEQRAAMMQFIAQRETHAPAVGDEAPDFELRPAKRHDLESGTAYPERFTRRTVRKAPRKMSIVPQKPGQKAGTPGFWMMSW